MILSWYVVVRAIVLPYTVLFFGKLTKPVFIILAILVGKNFLGLPIFCVVICAEDISIDTKITTLGTTLLLGGDVLGKGSIV